MATNEVGSRLVAGLLFVVSCCLLSGCSLTPTADLSQGTEWPTKAMVEDVPFFAQDELQCGPAALAMALTWSGVAIAPAELSTEVYTPGLEGSLQHSLVGSARRHGRVAYPITGMESLIAKISADHPVIILVNLGFFWYPRWHYAVVTGYDLEKEEDTLNSGATAGEILSFWIFNNIWKRSDFWGLLVLPPDRMPGSAEEQQFLAAVAGLESAEQWQAAATGYRTALERWKNSFIAWMGLGNSTYNLGDLNASTAAFSHATRLQPGNGAVYNNWANVLAEQGKTKEALLAAQRAVDLGGPYRDTFCQTLIEIKE